MATAPSADEIFNAVWQPDRLKGPWMTADNPTWAPQTILINGYANGLKALDAANAAKTNSASAKTDAAAAKAGIAQLQTAVTALSTTLTKTAADTAATRAAVARIEAAVAALQTTLAQVVADAVKAALAANTVAVDVTVTGNVPGTTPSVTLPR